MDLNDDGFFELTGRRPLATDTAAVCGELRERVVLVTGAAGSIGSALLPRLLRAAPARLVLLDAGEEQLDRLAERYAASVDDGRVVLALGHLLDRRFVDHLLACHAPDVVFHTAAHKHVPLLERQPLAALRNNVLGTARLLARLEAHGGALIALSTDKAVRPAGVMGASKRLVELLLLDRATDAPLRAGALRLGNVLGSRGSVLEKFRASLRRDGTLHVRHAEATRYFFSTDEAARLTLEALRLSRGADVLVPLIDSPTPILELARRVARREGVDPAGAIRVGRTLLPGEKLHEQLRDETESDEPTAHPAIRRVVGPRLARGELARWLVALERAIRDGSAGRGLELVREVLPDFAPSGRLAAAARPPEVGA